jgi:hypothetical protein
LFVLRLGRIVACRMADVTGWRRIGSSVVGGFVCAAASGLEIFLLMAIWLQGRSHPVVEAPIFGDVAQPA